MLLLTAQNTGPSGQGVELYFSNPDLLWANDFPRNRLGQVRCHALAWGVCGLSFIALNS
jgi:ribonucleotide monophosphatase NagD (HAD superfamily)